jgi:hypothetical protein
LETKTMTSRIPKLLLSFAALVALGCGARSTLDLLEEGEDGTGGSSITAATGGRGGAGGTTGQTSGYGGTIGTGGSGTGGTIGTGGTRTGGMFGTGGSKTGGTYGAAGMITTGGTFGTGGKTTTGGTFGTGGSKTGGTIGTGGMRTGGAIGTGGVTKTGGTPGTGGTLTTGGTIGTGGSKCPSPASNEDLIDNLDDGDRYIPIVNGRVGAWADDNDGSPGGTLYPDPAVGFTPTNSGDACYGYSAYVKGGYYSDWGANLRVGLGSPYDASKYAGITFWGRVDSGTKNVIHVNFPDNDTHPYGGICKTGVTGPTACYDNFGVYTTLSSTWKKYTIYFKETTQGGWGYTAAALDPSSLYEIIFGLPANSTFSLWIDDLAFFW